MKKVTAEIKIDSGGNMPLKGRDLDVAHDIFTSEDALITPSMIGATIVPTALHTAFNPEELALLILPRSSIFKMPLMLANSVGLIEGEYRGTIGIPLRNTIHHDPNMWSSFGLTLNAETGKIERINVEDIPKGSLEQAKEKYFEDLALLFDISFVDESSLFVTEIPHGSFFLPRNTRIMQALFTERYDTEFLLKDKLSDSERGANGFGSSGHN